MKYEDIQTMTTIAKKYDLAYSNTIYCEDSYPHRFTTMVEIENSWHWDKDGSFWSTSIPVLMYITIDENHEFKERLSPKRFTIRFSECPLDFKPLDLNNIDIIQSSCYSVKMEVKEKVKKFIEEYNKYIKEVKNNV